MSTPTIGLFTLVVSFCDLDSEKKEQSDDLLKVPQIHAFFWCVLFSPLPAGVSAPYQQDHIPVPSPKPHKSAWADCSAAVYFPYEQYIDA